MDNDLRPLIEKNVALVEKYYPGLKNSNRWEWTHKIAWLSWLQTNRVGQKSTSPSSPISEDTIGIFSNPINAVSGTSLFPAVFEAVDLVRGSDGELQWLSFGMVNQNFFVPLPADVSAIPSQPDEPDGKVPWVAYNEQGFERLKKMLKHDYERRPQGPDYDVSVWAGRYFHNCYMGPKGIPLGEQKALERIKPELCAALKIPVDDYYGE